MHWQSLNHSSEPSEGQGVGILAAMSTLSQSGLREIIHCTAFFLKSLHAQIKVIFVTEFVILCKNPPFYEVNLILSIKALRMEEFQKYFL